VSLLRGAGAFLGNVEAPDERSAEAAAAAQFGLNDEQRKRVAGREEGAPLVELHAMLSFVESAIASSSVGCPRWSVARSAPGPR
jgi:hypothetical protein